VHTTLIVLPQTNTDHRTGFLYTIADIKLHDLVKLIWNKQQLRAGSVTQHIFIYAQNLF
jgi:hypothetical protein